MFEKLKNKALEIAHKIDQRFNLSAKYGPIPFATDLDLSVRVISNKFEEERQKLVAQPQQYIGEKLNNVVDFTVNKIKEIGNKLANKTADQPEYSDKLCGWFLDRAVDASKLSEKIKEKRIEFESAKTNLIWNDNSKSELLVLMINRVEALKAKRKMYQERAKKQQEFNQQLKDAYQI